MSLISKIPKTPSGRAYLRLNAGRPKAPAAGKPSTRPQLRLITRYS